MRSTGAIAANPGAMAPGWLRSQAFDLQFIVGIAVLALASGFAVAYDPRLFGPILFADLWLLGYHHVIASYTRLGFDAASRREHRFLILWLPLIVIAAVAGLAAGIGLWTLATIYLYWQWFHYARQSWGVSQVYRRKAGGAADDDPRLAKLVFYAVPVWGILSRSHQDPGSFLGIRLEVIPVPEIAVNVAGAVAALTLLWWLATRLLMWWRGALPLAHTFYMLSHFVIFYVAYVLIPSIDVGWLVVNIWHNAQYIVFVWMFNANRFKDGVDPKARLLSTMSQPRNVWLYALVCLGLSTVIYLAVNNVLALLPLVPLVVVYQTLNFHHYVVDGVIWKVRKKSLQKTLGIDGQGRAASIGAGT